MHKVPAVFPEDEAFQARLVKMVLPVILVHLVNQVPVVLQVHKVPRDLPARLGLKVSLETVVLRVQRVKWDPRAPLENLVPLEHQG